MQKFRNTPKGVKATLLSSGVLPLFEWADSPRIRKSLSFPMPLAFSRAVSACRLRALALSRS